MIEIRLNSLGKNPESYVASRGDQETNQEQIIGAEKMVESQIVDVVSIQTGDKSTEASIEGLVETNLESSRAVINSPGASPRAPSEVPDEGSISALFTSKSLTSGKHL